MVRINKFVAQATGLSRRAADSAIAAGRVKINNNLANLGDSVTTDDRVTLDNRPITPAVKTLTIMLHKPAGYVCSRDGQGSLTVYELLPEQYHQLKPVGRLDKDSSGLLLLTNDGELANRLTHPRYQKEKVYEVTLDKPLTETDLAKLNEGVTLEDGLSHLNVSPKASAKTYKIVMSEGRNRQIRRTFAALDYTVKKLHRTHFGPYNLGDLPDGANRVLTSTDSRGP